MRQRIPRVFFRQQAIQHLRGKLEHEGYPRLQMMLLVTITGAVGFVTSYGLLRSGLDQMPVRYVAACGVAYLAFLGLLWLWMRSRVDDYLDVPDGSGIDFDPGSGGGVISWGGSGGQSGGGGASASFDAPLAPSSLATEDAVGDAFGSVVDADEFAIPLLVIGVVVVLLLSSLFVVYSAPILFAELLLDGALAAGLYRRLRKIETRHWLGTAVRRTAWPFVLTSAVLAALGFGMGYYAPGADSIGDVLHHLQQR